MCVTIHQPNSVITSKFDDFMLVGRAAVGTTGGSGQGGHLVPGSSAAINASTGCRYWLVPLSVIPQPLAILASIHLPGDLDPEPSRSWRAAACASLEPGATLLVPSPLLATPVPPS